jgi:hypothetical protein
VLNSGRGYGAPGERRVPMYRIVVAIAAVVAAVLSVADTVAGGH